MSYLDGWKHALHCAETNPPATRIPGLSEEETATYRAEGIKELKVLIAQAEAERAGSFNYGRAAPRGNVTETEPV